MTKLKNKSGITLVALIITIIVLLILAVVSISLLNDSGIISGANDAKEEWNKAKEEELVNLALLEARLEQTEEEKTNDWYYKKVENYLKNNGYSEEEAKRMIEENTELRLSTDILQEENEFMYYSSLAGAVADVNAATVGSNADSDKSQAVAGIYVKDGINNVVLLKDTLESTITITKDATLNLGGHTFASDNIALVINGANLTIDGKIQGSTILSETSSKSYAIQLRAGKAIIQEGTYLATATADSGVACGIMSAGDLNIQNATFRIENSGKAGKARALESKSGAKTVVSNSKLTTVAKSGVAISIYNSGTDTSIINSEIKAYSDYIESEGSRSQGICNNTSAEIYIENCNVMGTHTGISSEGNMVINKGTYEGVAHGGIYFGGTAKTYYVQNATIRVCGMPNGYKIYREEGVNRLTNTGFYIGSGNDIKVYMDNCNIFATRYYAILRATSGESNNSLYISNSKVNDLDKGLQFIIDENYGHEIYIGKGCNFTADNTNSSSSVTVTEETYKK